MIVTESPISCSGRRHPQKFTFVKSNFKNFENGFLKVVLSDDFPEVFVTQNVFPRFPFNWTYHPNKDIHVSSDSLTNEQWE